MKPIRKWSRILHRDIGFFFIGTTIIYALSGIALNHMHDWNPNYVVDNIEFNTELDLKNSASVTTNIKALTTELTGEDSYKKHYYPNADVLKIFLAGGSSIIVNTNSGNGTYETLKKRAVFYQSNVLHYNPNKWWTWFSDIFAGSLILFAITSLFMVRGKKGVWGRGGVYLVLGIVIPILFLIYMV